MVGSAVLRSAIVDGRSRKGRRCGLCNPTGENRRGEKRRGDGGARCFLKGAAAWSIWGGGPGCARWRWRGGVRSEFKQIQFKFKSSQNLIDPKGTISGSKNLKQNMLVNDVKKGITFSIETSSC
jgi:hypothetical protein